MFSLWPTSNLGYCFGSILLFILENIRRRQEKDMKKKPNTCSDQLTTQNSPLKCYNFFFGK